MKCKDKNCEHCKYLEHDGDMPFCAREYDEEDTLY